jgi:hypothetical protein
VGAEGRVIPFVAPPAPTHTFDPLAFDDPTDDRRELPRPLLIGGALTSAAISLAGAAFVAWRLARPGCAASPMARAVRAAHAGAVRGPRRSSATHIGRWD